MMKMDVVPTQDGGVVVLMGNKMVKYDKDLKQVKEVELKMDMDQTISMMQKQMKDCPMRKKMMEEGGMMQGKMKGECPHMKKMQEESAKE
jgi:hypothetical protein